MAIEPERFKAVLARFASGVTIISADNSQKLHGATASAFCSLSLNPPLVLVCLDLNSKTRAVIEQTGYFCVNVLSDLHRGHSDLFARKVMSEEELSKIGHRYGEHGTPILDDAMAYLECRVWARYPGGDHDIYVGEVLDAADTQAGRPLIYYQGSYRRLGEQM